MKKLLTLLFVCWNALLFAADPSQTIDADRTIDSENVQGSVPDVSAGAFTVALKFRPLAQGEQTFSGHGMLFSCASGYYDGFRAHYGNQDQRIYFEIGDTEARHSVGVQSRSPAVMGLWHDLVCTYDGAVMKICVDGEEVGSRETAVKIDTKNQPLKVGYVNFGIGSTKMEVGKLEYFTHAFTLAEVQARYAQMPELERKKIALTRAWAVSNNAVNLDVPTESLTELSGMEGVSEAFLASVRDTLWQQLMARGELAKAAPLVAAKAKTILASEIPAEETLPDQNVRLSELFEVLGALDRLGEFAECRTAAVQLRQKFSSESACLKKIHLLDEGMRSRTAEIERQAKARYETFCESAENPKNAVKLYLAPNGCDENDGSETQPLASLAAAMERAVKLQSEGTSVIVEAADGEYFVTRTFEANSDALPETNATIRVCAAPGAHPVFNGGVSLRQFSPVTDPDVRKRFQPQVRDQIRVCDLKRAGATEPGKLASRGYGCGNEQTPWQDLYVNGKAQTLARWPNAGEPELQIGEVIPGPNAVEKPPRSESETFRFDFDRPNGWQESSDVFAYGLWQWEWASRTVRVKKIDREARTIQIDYWNVDDRFTYHFLNVLEELDVPGEYFVDREKGLLYLLPSVKVDSVKDLRSAEIEYPVFAERFMTLTKQKNVLIEGLTFKNSQLGGFLFNQCEDVAIRNCEISQLGSSAVTFQGGRANSICDSEIRSVGSCGVRMFGGNRETLEPCFHQISNCEISDFSRVDRAYAPAAHVIGVGMIVTNNLMFDSPHQAMRVEGNDLLVARNEVHSVVYDFSDQSGIDIYCDPTYRGIVIDRNFWHHIGSSFALCGQAGIRLDDSISGVVMTENVFYRSSGGNFGGIQIHGGKDNLVARNLFADCSLGVSFSPWANDRFLEFIRTRFPKLVEPYQKLGVYPFMDSIEETPNRNYVYENEVVNCGQFVRNLNRQNLFMSNQVRTLQSQPKTDTPKSLRKWIETSCGRSISDIGIQPGLHFPKGQRGVKHSVSPNYYQEKKEN